MTVSPFIHTIEQDAASGSAEQPPAISRSGSDRRIYLFSISPNIRYGIYLSQQRPDPTNPGIIRRSWYYKNLLQTFAGCIGRHSRIGRNVCVRRYWRRQFYMIEGNRYTRSTMWRVCFLLQRRSRKGIFKSAFARYGEDCPAWSISIQRDGNMKEYHGS